MMKSCYHIQFRHKKSVICAYLPQSIFHDVEPLIRDGKHFSTVEIIDNDKLHDLLLSVVDSTEGKSLVRISRQYHCLDTTSIIEGSYYELSIDADNTAKLVKSPHSYYRFGDICRHCGYMLWIQIKDLELEKTFDCDLFEAENGEIIISDRLREALSKRCNEESISRKINISGFSQLVIKKQVTVKKTEYLIEKDFCSECNRARIVYMENSNAVQLIGGDCKVARQEKIAVVSIEQAPSDIAITSIEFGTLGRIPEGVKGVDPTDMSSKTSHPKMIVSGAVAKILLNYKIEGLRLNPVSIQAK